MLAAARRGREWEKRRSPFDLVLPIDRLLDPVDASDRDALVERCGRYRDLGTTVLNLRLRLRSLQHYLEQLDVVARDVMPRLA
jgi:hypothetical protein